MRKTCANGHKGLLVYFESRIPIFTLFLGVGDPVLGSSPFEYNEFASSY